MAALALLLLVAVLVLSSLLVRQLYRAASAGTRSRDPGSLPDRLDAIEAGHLALLRRVEALEKQGRPTSPSSELPLPGDHTLPIAPGLVSRRRLRMRERTHESSSGCWCLHSAYGARSVWH